MKEFTKRLQQDEQDLIKMTSNRQKLNNQIYRVAYFKERFSLDKDFNQSLLDKKIGKNIT